MIFIIVFVFFRSSMMWSLKTILLELFLQAHDMIVLGYKANELNIMFNFPMYQIIWNNEQYYDSTPFQISYVYDLLRSRELEDEVKTWSTTWYFFLRDYKWTKHFCVDRTFVQHLTKIKTFHGEKHQVALHYAHEYFCHLHHVQICACIRIFILFGIFYYQELNHPLGLTRAHVCNELCYEKSSQMAKRELFDWNHVWV